MEWALIERVQGLMFYVLWTLIIFHTNSALFLVISF